MSERRREFLREVYHAPENKIDLIPHGIPDMPFADPNYFKDEFGVTGKQVLLTESNYDLNFAPASKISQRVLFPSAPRQSNGIEGARFVRFQKDDSLFTHYATYTAFDGKSTLRNCWRRRTSAFQVQHPQCLTAQNKGMALFPRQINGQYVLHSRQDGENILIMFSPNIHFWADAKILPAPA
jgi:predicted GH43/DUF377 family glycosyl hydrolase